MCAFCNLLLVRVWEVPVVLFYMCKWIGKGVCFLQFVISDGVGGAGCTVLYVYMYREGCVLFAMCY